MLIHRICLIGALAALGACTTMPTPPPTGAPPSTPAAASTPSVPLPSRTDGAVAPASVTATSSVATAPGTPLPSSQPRPASTAKPAPVVIRRKPAAPRPAAAATEATEHATAASRVQISGRVALAAGTGQSVTSGDVVDTLVYFVPTTGAAHPKPGHYTIYTHNRDFSPDAMALPLGSTVTFINLDEVRHNVFSVTPGSAFDLGFQANGESAAHTFSHAGMVLVSCNVHHMMQADVLVVPTPYMAAVAADGSFTLRDLPPGPGTLHFWNPRATPATQSLSAPAAAVQQRLLALKPRVATSLNTGARP